MEESKDLKSRLTILEDEGGLELSLGLGCGGGGGVGGGSTSDKKVSKSSDPSPPSVAEGSVNSDQGFWVDAAKRKSSEIPVWNTAAAHRLRQAMQENASSIYSGKDETSAQQIAAAWTHLSKQPIDPSKLSGIQMAMGMNLGKQLGVKSQQVNGAGETHVQDEELEQQKRFHQHQEARKKRKMVIDEQKQQQQQKKKDEDGQDGAESLPSLHRTPSVGSFPVASSMGALIHMRRTISDPVITKEDSNVNSSSGNNENNTSSVVGAAKEPSQEPEGGQQSASEDAKTLASWQLGTTNDIPPVENINPELSTLRPGAVPGQIGGTGSSPDLPWVSATGPNGKTITGVVYKMYQGHFKVVCTCHGLHMSPTDFVRHAGQLEPSTDKGLAGAETISVLSQVTSA